MFMRISGHQWPGPFIHAPFEPIIMGDRHQSSLLHDLSDLPYH
jgi:hypothetical protein